MLIDINLYKRKCLRLINNMLSSSITFIFNLSFEHRLGLQTFPIIYNITHNNFPLKWLKVYDSWIYIMAMYVFQLLLTKTPFYLHSIFQEVPNKNTRVHNNDFIVPYSRTEFLKRSFHCMGSAFWNFLPVRIRKAESIETFKTNLRNYLLK